MTITLIFKLPHPYLRPNARVTWQIKHGITKQAREKAKREAFVAFQRIESPVWVIKGYTLKAYFKTKRHWDADNTLSACKGLLDGISDASGQNDKNFELTKVERYTDTQRPRLEVILDILEIV